MSLKAKIEAVIYASEEPVTLQQLVNLLGREAQAKLDAVTGQQGELALLEDDRPLEEFGRSKEGAGDPGVDTPAPDDSVSASRAGDKSAAELSSPAEAPSAGTLAQGRVRERQLREYMRSILAALVAEYDRGDRGLEIREVAGGYRFATKPEYHDAVRGFVRSLKPPLKLSLQALETLAVVAYKQPVTAPEVSEIRGVDSGGVLGSLMTRKLVTTAGRKQVIGRPILYKTTKEFLLRFGLKDLAELPSIEEFERLASNLNEVAQEEISMPNTPVVPVGNAAEMPRMSAAEVARELEPSRSEHSAQADGDPNARPLSSDEVSAEGLTPAGDGPGEFTGNESAPPADNAVNDGRLSGVPPSYDTGTSDLSDSPANDAAAQAGQTDIAGGEK